VPFSVEVVFAESEFPWSGWEALLERFGRTERVEAGRPGNSRSATSRSGMSRTGGWVTRIRNSVVLSELEWESDQHVVSLATSDRCDPAAIWAQLVVPYVAARSLDARAAWRGRSFEDPEAYRRWATRMLKLRVDLRVLAASPPTGSPGLSIAEG